MASTEPVDDKAKYEKYKGKNEALGKPKALCGIRRPPPKQFGGGVAQGRLGMIATPPARWARGSTITYGFLPDGDYLTGDQLMPSRMPEGWADEIRRAFQTWMALGISIQFVEEEKEPAKAKIRIAFMDDGAWSGVGTEILRKDFFRPGQPTMNFGFLDPMTAEHEIGHSLGLQHEHQNPKAGLTWNEPAVYKWAKVTQGWDQQKTYFNIIKKLEPNDVKGTKWDPTSVMHYGFDAGLISSPEQYAKAGIPFPTKLSEQDKAFIRQLYPPVAPNSIALEQVVPIGPGETILTLKPTETKRYIVQTSGNADTLLLLLGKDGRKIAADDDSGEDKNAKFEVDLKAGETYTVTVRVFWPEVPEASLKVSPL